MKNDIKKSVETDIKEHGFKLAYHYWASSVAWGKPLSKTDKAIQKAFDKYYKKHKNELEDK